MPLRRPQASRALASSSLSLNPCHHLKPGGLRLRRAVSETVTCARMQRSWSAPDTARPLGSGDSQGPTCPLDVLSLRRQGTRRPLQDKAPGPAAGCGPLFSPPWGSGAISGDRLRTARKVGLRVGCLPPPRSGEAVLFLKPSLSVCLAQNVSGAPG